MKYLSKSGRTFDAELLCLRDENNFLMEELRIHNKPPDNNFSINNIIIDTRNLNLSMIEKKCIVAALMKHKHNRRMAANELGISDRTLYRKLEVYNISDKS